MTLLNLRAPVTLSRAIVFIIVIFFSDDQNSFQSNGSDLEPPLVSIQWTAEQQEVSSINQVLGNLWINALNATLSSVCSHWINTSNATLSSVVIPDFIMTGFRNWFSDSWLSPETLNSSFFLPPGLRVQIVRTIKKNDNNADFFFHHIR